MGEIKSATALDVLRDGRWRWIPRRPEGGIQIGRNVIWFDGGPTDHGYYPRDEERVRPGSDACWQVDYFANEAGTPYRGWDNYTNIGHVGLGGERLEAFITNWPSPEFMNTANPDSALFIRVYGPDEVISPFNF